MAKKPVKTQEKRRNIPRSWPRGGKKDNFATVKDNERFPPTTKAGHGWVLDKRTPDSKSNNQAGSLRLF